MSWVSAPSQSVKPVHRVNDPQVEVAGEVDPLTVVAAVVVVKPY
jgi:hypothetical protein